MPAIIMSDFVTFLRSFCFQERPNGFFEPVVKALKDSGFPCVDGEELLGATEADVAVWPEGGVHKAFLRRVLKEANAPPPPVETSVNVSQALSVLQPAPKSEPKKKLKVAEKLAKTTLGGWLTTLLPSQEATDAATTGGKFEFAEVRNFLPSWGKDGMPVDKEEGSVAVDCVALVSLAKALGLPTKAKEVPLDLSQWCGGYSRMALHQVADGRFLLYARAGSCSVS